jgi:hypothetical protein
MQIYLALVSDPVPTRLIDMGFPREMCVEAITAVGGSLDAATDYLQQSLSLDLGRRRAG